MIRLFLLALAAATSVVVQGRRILHVVDEMNSVVTEVFKIFDVEMAGGDVTDVQFATPLPSQPVLYFSTTSNDKNAAIVWFSNITPSGFSMKILNSPFCKEEHGTETVYIMAVAEGSHLDDGRILNVGLFEHVNTDPKTITFPTAYHYGLNMYTAVQGVLEGEQKEVYATYRVDPYPSKTSFKGGVLGARTLYCDARWSADLCKNQEPFDLHNTKFLVGYIAFNVDEVKTKHLFFGVEQRSRGYHMLLDKERCLATSCDGHGRQCDLMPDGKLLPFISATSNFNLRPGVMRLTTFAKDSTCGELAQDACGGPVSVPKNTNEGMRMITFVHQPKYVVSPENSVVGDFFRVFQVDMPAGGRSVRVRFETPLSTKPVMIYSMFGVSQAAVVTFSNVTVYGFDMKIVKSPFCPAEIPAQTVNIMAFAEGTYDNDGRHVKAFRYVHDTSGGEFTYTYDTPYPSHAPHMYAAVQGVVEGDKVDGLYAIYRLTLVATTKAFHGGIVGARTLFCTPISKRLTPEQCANQEPFDIKKMKYDVGFVGISMSGVATRNMFFGKPINSQGHEHHLHTAQFCTAMEKGGEVPTDGSTPIPFVEIESFETKRAGMMRVNSSTFSQMCVQFIADNCGRDIPVPNHARDHIRYIIFNKPPLAPAMPVAPPALPTTTTTTEAPTAAPTPSVPLECDPSNVNLELFYIQENTLSYCGKDTCAFTDEGEAKLVKQQAIKDNLFDAVDALKKEYASVKIGYSEFADKGIEPFGQDGLDFCYKFFNSLTPYTDDYRAWIEDHWARKWGFSSSGRDYIENQLDAVISSVMRAGFSESDVAADGKINLRVAVMMTDKMFHTAGDVRAAHPSCAANGKNLCADYVPSADTCQCVGSEYPTAEQAIDVLIEKKVNPVFLIGNKSSAVRGSYDAFNAALSDFTVGHVAGASVAAEVGEWLLFDGGVMRSAVGAVCTNFRNALA